MSGTVSSESASDSVARGRRLWVDVIVKIAATAAICSAMITIVSFGARWNSLCELATHWKVQVAFVAGFASVMLLLTRRWKFAAFTAAIAFLNACYIVPLYLQRPGRPLSGREFKVVSANVLTVNQDSKRFLRLVEAERPDLLLVMEVNDRWAAALEEIHHDYPFRIMRPRSDNFGIALFSRYPISSERIEFFGGPPTIVAEIDVDGRRIQVIGAHPVPPIGGGREGLRDSHLRALGDLTSRLPRPVILLGDLNTTSWSPCFSDLLARGGLRDSRQGFGVQPTWPSRPQLLRIPIDHALLSANLIVTQHRVGPDIGSDHLPIIIDVDYAFESNPPQGE